MAIISTCCILFFLCYVRFHASEPTSEPTTCERLYFDHGHTSQMPYVQLTGIYRKINESNGHPMFKHEQRNYIFEYINAKGENSMAFTYLNPSTLQRSIMGLNVKMKSEFRGESWQSLISNGNTVQPYQKFISYWSYYDWQSESYHHLYRRDAMKLVCVPNDVFRCSSGRVYFNATFTSLDDGGVLHNHLTDYFEEKLGVYNSYKSDRKIYRHSRKTKWKLYYQSPYWMVKHEGYTPFLRARDSAFRPEYITSVWETVRGSSWERFTNPVGIRCRGLPQKIINGTVPSCSEWNPCLNGGVCIKSNLTNETVCICGEAYRGPTCSEVSPRCQKYLYPSTVRQVVIYGLEESNFASVFCKKSYQPSFFISQCQQGSVSSKWTSQQQCRYVPPTTKTKTTKVPVTVRTPRKTKAPVTVRTFPWWRRPKQQKKPFNFDDYYWSKPVLLAIVPLLQVAIPSIHMILGIMKDKSALRIISLHAFITYIVWLIYLFGCNASQCHQYGEVMEDFTIMGIVMVILSYFYMLIEACCSPENEYIASISADVSVVDYVNKLRSTDPVRIMMIECYHMETRTRTVYYTDAQGNTQTRLETYQEMVTTYTENKVFPIGRSVDVSNPEGLRFDLHSVTRLKLEQYVKCGDLETTTKFSEMRDQMIEENEHRDDKICFTCEDIIDGFKKRLCAYTDTKHRSFWMNLFTFWFANFLGLTWVYRALFNWKTKKLEYTIQKEIFLGTEAVVGEQDGPRILYHPDGFDRVNHYGNDANGMAALLPPTQQPSANQATEQISIEVPGIPSVPPPAYNEISGTENRTFQSSSF